MVDKRISELDEIFEVPNDANVPVSTAAGTRRVKGSLVKRPIVGPTWDMSPTFAAPDADTVNANDATYDAATETVTFNVAASGGGPSFAHMPFQTSINLSDGGRVARMNWQVNMLATDPAIAIGLGFTDSPATVSADILAMFMGQDENITANNLMFTGIVKGDDGDVTDPGSAFSAPLWIDRNLVIANNEDATPFSTELQDGQDFDIIFDGSTTKVVQVATGDEKVAEYSTSISTATSNDLKFFSLILDYSGADGTYTAGIPFSFNNPYPTLDMIASREDAVIPTGTVDGDRYIAQPGDRWKTYSAQTGDVVEFYNNQQDLFVYRDIPLEDITTITDLQVGSGAKTLFHFDPSSPTDRVKGVYENWSDLYTDLRKFTSVGVPVEVTSAVTDPDIVGTLLELPSGNYDFTKVHFKDKVTFGFETGWTGEIITTDGVLDLRNVRLLTEGLDAAVTHIFDLQGQGQTVRANSFTQIAADLPASSTIDLIKTGQTGIALRVEGTGQWSLNPPGSSFHRCYIGYNRWVDTNIAVLTLEQGAVFAVNAGQWNTFIANNGVVSYVYDRSGIDSNVAVLESDTTNYDRFIGTDSISVRGNTSSNLSDEIEEFIHVDDDSSTTYDISSGKNMHLHFDSPFGTPDVSILLPTGDDARVGQKIRVSSNAGTHVFTYRNPLGGGADEDSPSFGSGELMTAVCVKIDGSNAGWRVYQENLFDDSPFA